MIKDIVRDEAFLRIPSTEATVEDIGVADDLADTLRANMYRCVGMAANMIGVSKRIIVFCDGDKICEMFNPRILRRDDVYAAEEGCLSLSGTRPVKRYKSVKVQWQTRDFKVRAKVFTGFTAQIIQHEADHLEGILI